MHRGLVVVALACGSARAETWRMRAALDNDAFTSVVPPLDDLGFTNDFALALKRVSGGYAFGGAVFHRMLTSRLGPERWDQLDIVGTAEREVVPGFGLRAWLGPTFGGNFGGRAIQNWWHGWSGTGPTIEQGLAHVYPGDRRIGVLAGVRGTFERGPAYVIGLGQLALGQTGVTHAELTAGVRPNMAVRCTTLGAHGEVALGAYHVGDPNLALPGGYHNGPQLEWRVGVDVAWSRYAVSYEYRANEGGSGEPIGVIAFDAAW